MVVVPDVAAEAPCSLGTAYLSTLPPVLYPEPSTHVTSSTVDFGVWEALCPRPMT